jgi:hypothetical protein
MPVRIELTAAMFGEKERPVCSMGAFEVSAFRYDSGIAALRVKNSRGEIIVLPFKGHQIWRAHFDGRDLTMKSMFDEPAATTTYLETYGAFFIHRIISRPPNMCWRRIRPCSMCRFPSTTSTARRWT